MHQTKRQKAHEKVKHRFIMLDHSPRREQDSACHWPADPHMKSRPHRFPCPKRKRLKLHVPTGFHNVPRGFRFPTWS